MVLQTKVGDSPGLSERWQPRRPLLESVCHCTGGSQRSSTLNIRFSERSARCTPAVEKTKKLWNSRKCSRPITMSTSADGRKTPPIGTWPGLSGLGASSGAERICTRRSGEAPTRNHTRSSGENTVCVCVRGRARNVPARIPLQLRQAQFHCGKPPPAAEPKILIFTCVVSGKRVGKKLSVAGLRKGGYKTARPLVADGRCKLKSELD